MRVSQPTLSTQMYGAKLGCVCGYASSRNRYQWGRSRGEEERKVERVRRWCFFTWKPRFHESLGRNLLEAKLQQRDDGVEFLLGFSNRAAAPAQQEQATEQDSGARERARKAARSRVAFAARSYLKGFDFGVELAGGS